MDDLYAFYRPGIPSLRLAKLGCSGETTSSMISGLGSGCTYPAGSQLSQAIAFLQSHPQQVALITLDIGADNLLECYQPGVPFTSCVAAATWTAANDLAVILGALKSAIEAYAPEARIVGMNYFDPFLAAWVFGPSGQALAAASLPATVAFNSALDAVYQALRVPVADVAGTFRIQTFPANVIIALAWTWMSAQPPRGPDVHPNVLGYFAIATAFARTIATP